MNSKKISRYILVFIIIFISSKPAVLSEESVKRIEGEWFQNSQLASRLTNPELGMPVDFFSNGGSAVINGNVANMPSGGYTLSYEVYMPNSGLYKMDFLSTQNSQTLSTSPFTVDINHSDEFTVSAKTALSIDERYAYYSAKIGLKSGLNTITFHIKEPKTGDSSFMFCLDYFDLTFFAQYSNSFQIESDDFCKMNATATKMAQSANTGLSGGVAYQFSNPATSPINIEYAIFVEDEGYYSLKSVCSELGKTYTSDFDVIVNNIAYPVNLNTVTKLGDITAAYDTGLYKKYDHNVAIYLKVGYNKIIIHSEEIRTSNIYLFCLDYIAFSKISNNIIIEGESNVSGVFTKVANTSASGGNILNLSTSSTNLPLQLSYPFKTKVSGNYDVFIDMGGNVKEDENAQSFADVMISLDGVNFTQLTCGTPGDNWSNANLELVNDVTIAGFSGLSKYKYKVPATLICGQNTITLKLVTNGNTSAVFYLDKIECKPVPFDLNTASVSTPKSALAIDETTTINILAVNGSGAAINLDEFRANGMVTFSSSDIYVASVNSLGVIKAKHPGITNIQVCMFDGIVTKNFNFDIAVYDETDKIVILNTDIDARGVVAKVAVPKGEALSNTFQMIFAKYDSEKMKNIMISNIDTGPALLVQTIKADFTASVGDRFNIFMWHELNTVKPVLRKTVIYK